MCFTGVDCMFLVFEFNLYFVFVLLSVLSKDYD